MNPVLTAAVALLPMAAMLWGMAKIVAKANRLLEEHARLATSVGDATERVTVVCDVAVERARVTMELASAMETRVALPEVRALALDVLRALHRCPVVPPAPRFRVPPEGSPRIAMIEMT